MKTLEFRVVLIKDLRPKTLSNTINKISITIKKTEEQSEEKNKKKKKKIIIIILSKKSRTINFLLKKRIKPIIVREKIKKTYSKFFLYLQYPKLMLFN